MALATRELAKFSMSLEELAACEDFLDGHREYATELLSDIEAIRRWHKADSCPGTRDGQPCPLCELCDDNGLLGATKSVLGTYEDADSHLKQVRASLNASGRGTSTAHAWSLSFRPRSGGASPHTLFTSPLAKAVFLGVVSVGEALRAQHATWSVRLQSIVANMSAPGSGDTDKNRKWGALPPAYVDPTIADPKLSASAPGFAPELTPNSSMFLVSRRCLAGDCCCDAGGSHAALRVPPPPPVSKKTSKFKATQSLATNRSKKARDTLAQPRADVQTGRATRAFHTPTLQGVMPGAHKPSGPASNAATSTQETETFPSSPECEELIVDPRVFRLRPELVRSNVGHRALMDWCRAWLAELRSDPLETGLTDESITRGTLGCSSALSLVPEKVEPQRSRHTARKVGEVTTKKLSHGDDETTVQEIQFNSQEELKERWLTARRKRNKRPEKRHSSRLKVFK